MSVPTRSFDCEIPLWHTTCSTTLFSPVMPDTCSSPHGKIDVRPIRREAFWWCECAPKSISVHAFFSRLCNQFVQALLTKTSSVRTHMIRSVTADMTALGCLQARPWHVHSPRRDPLRRTVCAGGAFGQGCPRVERRQQVRASASLLLHHTIRRAL